MPHRAKGSPDDLRYFFINSYPQELYAADKRSLDELIGLANETIAGHELSDSERYIYQVGN